MGGVDYDATRPIYLSNNILPGFVRNDSGEAAPGPPSTHRIYGTQITTDAYQSYEMPNRHDVVCLARLTVCRVAVSTCNGLRQLSSSRNLKTSITYHFSEFFLSYSPTRISNVEHSRQDTVHTQQCQRYNLRPGWQAAKSSTFWWTHTLLRSPGVQCFLGATLPLGTNHDLAVHRIKSVTGARVLLTV
jgi:hypothetical protein